MKTVLEFEIMINSHPSRIWECITKHEPYRMWAAAFHEGSFFEGGWEVGDTIRFLIINKNGLREGMVAEIAKAIYPTSISIKHLGFVVDGKDDTESPEVKSWSPAFENYEIEEVEPKSCRFAVRTETAEAYVEMMKGLWPKALKILKEESEKPQG